MLDRVSLGPVFKYEWLCATRRWQLYGLRSLFVGSILAAISLIWLMERPDDIATITRAYAAIGVTLFWTMVCTQLTMVLLIAPATTAGSVCLDKARGTLDHIFATELTNSEIVMGKLAVRLIPLLGIVGSLLPAMILTTLIGGVDPNALIGAFLVTLGTTLVATTVTMFLSVWGTKVHEVLFTSYLILLSWVMFSPFSFVVLEVFSYQRTAYWLWESTKRANPYYLAVAPYVSPGVVDFGTWLAFLGACLAVSGLLTFVAARRIRIVCQKQAGRGTSSSVQSGNIAPQRWQFWARGPRITFLEPTLDGNPVLWREWHRNRPSRWMSRVWKSYAAFSLFLTAIVAILAVNGLRGPMTELAAMATAFQVNAGLLLLNVQAATSLSEERMRGSLDVLMTTPLTTLRILTGKWLGAWRILPKLLILPALDSLLLVTRETLELWPLLLLLLSGYGAVAISVGLACATRITRLARAISASIGLCVLYNFFVLVTVIVLETSRSPDLGIFYALAGSLSGSFVGSVLVSPNPFANKPLYSSHDLFLAASILQYLFATALFLVTLASFDNCLGRITSRRRHTRPAKKGQLIEARPKAAQTPPASTGSAHSVVQHGRHRVESHGRYEGP